MQPRKLKHNTGRDDTAADHLDRRLSSHGSQITRISGRTSHEFPADFDGLLGQIYAGATQSQISRLLTALNRDAQQSRASWLDQCVEPTLPDSARADLTLESTKRLFKAALQRRSSLLSQALVAVGRLALQAHCAFDHLVVQGCIKASDDRSRDVPALEILADQDYSVLSWPAETPGLSRKQFKQCRQSALVCLICWLATARRLTSEEVWAYLDEFVWKGHTKVPKSDQSRVSSLITASPSSFKTTAVVTALSEERSGIQRQELADQRRRLSRAEGEGRRSAQELHGLKEDLASVRNVRAGLERDLANEKAQHVATRVHLQDDYERLRSRLSRNLESVSSLLNDGLQALDRDPPKLDVVEHHMRLVQDALNAELERLKGDVDDEHDRV